MVQSFQRLRAGEPWRVNEPTARAIIESAEDWQRHRADPGGTPPPTYTPEATIVDVRNQTGSVLPRFGVAGIDAPIFDDAANLAEFQNYVRFNVITPTSSHAGRFVVAIEPIAAGAVGRAVIAGVVNVQINLPSGTTTAPAFADIVPGQTAYLAPASSGAQVLWCQTSGSAPQWATIRLQAGNDDLRPWELTADFIPGPASGTTPTTLSGVFLDDPAGYGSEAAQTLYWIGDPAVPTRPATLGVGRARNVSYSQIGTRGLARWNPDGETVSTDPNYPAPGRAEIVWGDFKILAEAVVGYAAIPNGGTGSANLWWWDATAAAMIDSGNAIAVTNISGRPVAPGETLDVFYDRREDRWYCDHTRAVSFYGVAQSDWTEGGTRPADPSVSIKLCQDRKGTSPSGSALDCFLPRVGDQDPQVYAYDSSPPYSAPAYPGDVVQFQFDVNGDAVAIGSYLGPRIGTITTWSGATNTMPYGWCLCDGSNSSPDLRSRFVMGCDPADSDGLSDEAQGATGGYRWHGNNTSGSGGGGPGDTGPNGHPDHPHHNHVVDGTSYALPGIDDAGPPVPQNNDVLAITGANEPIIAGDEIASGSAVPGQVGNGTPITLNHAGPFNTAAGPPAVGDSDNRPRFMALAFIYRYK